MFRHELSEFLTAVLDAVAVRPHGVSVDARGTPCHDDVAELARALGAAPDDVAQALIGLRAAHCLIEHELELEGVEPLLCWVVHPQCEAAAPSPASTPGSTKS